MKLLTAEQIREWDQYTISREPIAPIDLMERAATACVTWLSNRGLLDRKIIIICGKGNNGGDGLAIARLLSEHSADLDVYILESGDEGSPDFRANLERLHYPIRFIQNEKSFPSFRKNAVIIDALFGTGLNRPLEGLAAKLVEHINQSFCSVVSIDIPSGLPADGVVRSPVAVRADHVLTFQTFKFSFLLAANSNFVGDVHILDIGLHPGYYESIGHDYQLIDPQLIRSLYKPRDRFAHKGNFGHALVIAGSYGKIGAAVLATKACLRTGAGLTTCHIPRAGYAVLQSAVPEAMVSADPNSYFITKIEEDLSKFTAVGIGPGIGISSETKKFFSDLITGYNKPLILDADALNILAAQPGLLAQLPPDSILTPHPKEFQRLFGECSDEWERVQLARSKAKQFKFYIVLKGNHTAIASPSGELYFNNTGNAGLAKGGTGDALTGILIGLAAQGYSSLESALLGVYLHGLAADLAAEKLSQESLLATDVIDYLPMAFKTLN